MNSKSQILPKQNVGKQQLEKHGTMSQVQCPGASERNLICLVIQLHCTPNGFDGDFIVEGSMESVANVRSTTNGFKY